MGGGEGQNQGGRHVCLSSLEGVGRVFFQQSYGGGSQKSSHPPPLPYSLRPVPEDVKEYR